MSWAVGEVVWVQTERHDSPRRARVVAPREGKDTVRIEYDGSAPPRSLFGNLHETVPEEHVVSAP